MREQQSNQNQKKGYSTWEELDDLNTNIIGRAKLLSKIKIYINKLLGLAMLISPILYYNDAALFILNIGKNLSSETFSEMFMLIIYLFATILWYSIGFRLLFSKKY